MDVVDASGEVGRSDRNASRAAGHRESQQRLHAATQALSRRDEVGAAVHGSRYRGRAGRHALLRTWQLVSGSWRYCGGARCIRAIHQVGRMAGLRLHHVRDRVETTSRNAPMTTEIIALRIIHIFSAIFWLGAFSFVTF